MPGCGIPIPGCTPIPAGMPIPGCGIPGWPPMNGFLKRHINGVILQQWHVAIWRVIFHSREHRQNRRRPALTWAAFAWGWAARALPPFSSLLSSGSFRQIRAFRFESSFRAGSVAICLTRGHITHGSYYLDKVWHGKVCDSISPRLFEHNVRPH